MIKRFSMRSLLTFILLTVPTAFVTANEFIPLVGIPKVPTGAGTDLEGYINGLMTLAITAAAVLAVLKLISAGAKYTMSDVVTNKQDAKSDIKGALLGLLLIVGAVTILNEINPNITRLDIFNPTNRAIFSTLPDVTLQAPIPNCPNGTVYSSSVDDCVDVQNLGGSTATNNSLPANTDGMFDQSYILNQRTINNDLQTVNGQPGVLEAAGVTRLNFTDRVQGVYNVDKSDFISIAAANPTNANEAIRQHVIDQTKSACQSGNVQVGINDSSNVVRVYCLK